MSKKAPCRLPGNLFPSNRFPHSREFILRRDPSKTKRLVFDSVNPPLVDYRLTGRIFSDTPIPAGPYSMTEAARTPHTSTAPALPAGLVERVRRGDPEALGELFEACFDDIYGLAVRMLGNPTQAEDVTQEVFLRLHRSAATLDPDRDPRPWLRTLTANLCRDHWRSFGAKVGQKSVALQDDADEEQPSVQLTNDGPSPEAEAVSRQQASHVQAAIDKLPAEQREAVVLKEYEGLSHEEIAVMVGVSPAAVRKRYSRALGALGELLKDVWP